MIRKIIEVLNVGRFLSLRPEGGNEAEFAKFNVIYAENGAGKSTLCDVLRSMGERNGSYVIGRKKFGCEQSPKIQLLLSGTATVRFENGQWTAQGEMPPVYVYDERFVRENVYVGNQISIEQRRNVYELALGVEGVRLNAAVNQAALQYERAKADFDIAETALERLLPPDYDIPSFCALTRLEDVSIIETLTQRFQSAQVQQQQQIEKIRRKPLLSSLVAASFPSAIRDVLEETIDSLTMSAEVAIKEHLSTGTDGALSINWLQQGVGVIKDARCPFCGQSIAGNSLLASYRAYFSGAIKMSEERRNAVKLSVDQRFGEKAVQSIVALYKENSNAVEWWHDVCGVALSLPAIDAQTITELMSNVRQIALAAIGRKAECMSARVDLTADEAQVVASWNDALLKVDEYNRAVASANEVIEQYKATSGSVDLGRIQCELQNAKCRERRYSVEVEQAIADYDRKKQAKRDAQNNKTEANASLKRQSEQLFAQYGGRINDCLEAFGVPFRVENGGIDMHGGASGRLSIVLDGVAIDSSGDAAADPSRASLVNTLSGGDRSALALAYFLASVETSSNLDRAIVAFDDPYHSQDRSRCQMTISLIERVAVSCSQCFVFSHNIDFANEIARIKGVGDGKRTFVISSVGESVSLKRQNLPDFPTKAYEIDYKGIADFIEEPSDDQLRLRGVVRSIRQVLETYLRNKFVGVFNEDCWLGDMIGMIRGASDAQNWELIRSPADTLVDELTFVNEYTSRYYHGAHGDVIGNPNARELLVYARRTLEIIRR